MSKPLLEVTVIGAGSAFAKKYANTSLLVEFKAGYGLLEKDYTLLIDCGYSVPRALHEQGISIDTIDGVLITHLHADHVNGLEELAFMNRYAFGNRKIDLYVPARIMNELWENTLKGGLQQTEEGECEITDYFNCKNLYENSVNGLGIQIFRTDHVKNKVSYAIGIGDELLYSGDTKFDPELIHIGHENYKTIIHDCQLPLPNGKVIKGGVHAHLHELMSLDEEIQKKMYLIHYGDNVETFVGRTGRLRFATEGTTYLI